MTTQTQSTEYRCGICENTQWVQKTHFTSHKLTDDHKAQFKAIKKIVEKLTLDMRQTEYGETDIKKIMKKKVELVRTNSPLASQIFTRSKRSHRIVYERSSQEIEEIRKEEEFKSLFISKLNKWHNSLRGCSVTGDDALDDILYCLFLCYLSSKVSTEGDFDLANSDKSCYKGIVQTKIKDWISKLNIDYLINNTAELITKKNEDSSIYKCGELMSRHPITKQLIKNKKFINCKSSLILSQLLKECKEFSKTHNIFNKIDIIGIAWEYFNTKHGGNGGSSKERGQYFTERPVMGMCCQLIEPTHIKELGIDNNSTLGDEFCATFGFPLYTKKFMKDKFDISIQDKNIYGVEFEDRLSRFGIMNAMFSLKKFKNIISGDSFITNVSPHLDFSVHNVPMGHAMNCANIKATHESERSKDDSNLPEFKDVVPIEKNGDAILSAQLVVYKTKKMGLIIIKDGEEITGPSNKKWREWFCNGCVIHKIMKIPPGAFSNTKTKTACVYFTKREGQKTEKIQFLEMSDTGDKITEICEVSRKDLQQNDYSWEPNAYIVDEDMEKLMASSNCEWKKLGDVCEILGGSILSKKNFVAGLYPVIGGGKSPAGYHNKFNKDANTILCSQSGTAGHISRYNTPVWASDCFSIKSNLNNSYLYYYLKSIQSNLYKLKNGAGPGHVYSKDIIKLDIPNPPLETQAQVVKTLDDLATLRQNYMDIRDGLERRTKYYFETMIKKHRKEITMAKLGDVCEINKYNITKTDSFKNIKYIDLTSIDKGKINEIKTIEFNKKPSRANRKVNIGNILLGTVRPNLKNHTIITDKIWENNLIVSTAFSVLESKTINPKYLYFCIMTDKINQQLINLATGTPPTINSENVKNTIIPVLPNEIIDEIVKYLDNLEAEKNKITKILKQLDIEMREILTQSYQSGDGIIQSSDDIIQPIDINDELIETLQ
jgi:type I restriction enzyme, S subunit